MGGILGMLVNATSLALFLLLHKKILPLLVLNEDLGSPVEQSNKLVNRFDQL